MRLPTENVFYSPSASRPFCEGCEGALFPPLAASLARGSRPFSQISSENICGFPPRLVSQPGACPSNAKAELRVQDIVSLSNDVRHSALRDRRAVAMSVSGGLLSAFSRRVVSPPRWRTVRGLLTQAQCRRDFSSVCGRASEAKASICSSWPKSISHA
jgi:hypothetical protein